MIEAHIDWSVTKKKTMSSLTKYLQERISELESQINSNTGDLETLKKELNRIQNLEMEEDLRESDNRNLLQG